MLDIACSGCQKPFPSRGIPHLCPDCGGVFDWVGFPDYVIEPEITTMPGIWRFRHMFGLEDDAQITSLGEGKTPAIAGEAFGSRVFYKLEYLNPSGSYKDRGSAVLLSYIKSRGIRMAVEDSSGNAGASFAAYAARAGVKSRVYVPVSASGPKRAQIEAYGAELIAVAGPRSAAAQAVLRDVEGGLSYASHAYLPFGMLGIATIAYELIEQLHELPGTIVAPVGHGSLLLGIIRGFTTLKQSGRISRVPTYIGVQSAACAPVWQMAKGNVGLVIEGETLAEGVRVLQPVRARALIQEMTGEFDQIVVVGENQILSGMDSLGKQGFFVEPTSAVVWDALQQVCGKVPAPIVVVLSGSGFKYRQE